MSTNPKVPSGQLSNRGVVATLLLLLGSGLLKGCQAGLFRSLNAAASKAHIVLRHDAVVDRTDQLALDVYRLRDAHEAAVVVFSPGGS